MTIQVQTCRSCGAGMLWLAHEKTGKSAPITMRTYPDGNITINEAAGTYRIVPVAERESFAGKLHKNHFADCPDAAKFGKKAR